MCVLHLHLFIEKYLCFFNIKIRKKWEIKREAVAKIDIDPSYYFMLLQSMFFHFVLKIRHLLRSLEMAVCYIYFMHFLFLKNLNNTLKRSICIQVPGTQRGELCVKHISIKLY